MLSINTDWHPATGIQHYADVRRRLMTAKPKPAPVVSRGFSVAVRDPGISFRNIKWVPDNDAHVRHWRAVTATREQPARLSPHDVFALALKGCPFSREEILCDCRNVQLVEWRTRLIFDVAKACWHMSYPQIGAFFNRDHTTVLYAVRRENLRRGENLRNAGSAPKLRRDTRRESLNEA